MSVEPGVLLGAPTFLADLCLVTEVVGPLNPQPPGTVGLMLALAALWKLAIFTYHLSLCLGFIIT